jgi:hypothetical protein
MRKPLNMKKENSKAMSQEQRKLGTSWLRQLIFGKEKRNGARSKWLTPVIPATQEGESRRFV